MTSGCIFQNGAPTQGLRKVRILTIFGLCYAMRENVKNKENANFVYTVYRLAKICLLEAHVRCHEILIFLVKVS